VTHRSSISPLLLPLAAALALTAPAGRAEGVRTVVVHDLEVAFAAGPRIEGRELVIDPEAPSLAFRALRGRWLGGILTLLPPEDGALRPGDVATTKLLGLDLQALANLLEIEGLSGSGLLDGQVRLRWDEGSDMGFEEGSIASRRAGIIRWRPSSTPAALAGQGAGVALLLEALENFHYSRISITFEGRLEGAMQVGVHLEGNNPDLYGGHPFELNVNFEGALGLLARQAIGTYRLPSTLADSLVELLR